MITIRDFRQTDSPALAKLFFDTIRNVNIADYTLEQVEAWAPENIDPVAWEKSFDNKFVFVAEDGSGIAGFGELEANGHIDRFYVARRCIGTGVGKRIYQELELKARDLDLTELFVEASVTAKNFFQGLGFKIEEEQTVQRRGVSFTNLKMRKWI